MDYWFRSRNYSVIGYTLGRSTLSIDQFVSEIQNRKKNDLAELDKKLGDKMPSIIFYFEKLEESEDE